MIKLSRIKTRIYGFPEKFYLENFSKKCGFDGWFYLFIKSQKFKKIFRSYEHIIYNSAELRPTNRNEIIAFSNIVTVLETIKELETNFSVTESNFFQKNFVENDFSKKVKFWAMIRSRSRIFGQKTSSRNWLSHSSRDTGRVPFQKNDFFSLTLSERMTSTSN